MYASNYVVRCSLAHVHGVCDVRLRIDLRRYAAKCRLMRCGQRPRQCPGGAVEGAVTGMLAPEIREQIVGLAEVRDVFKSPKLVIDTPKKSSSKSRYPKLPFEFEIS